MIPMLFLDMLPVHLFNVKHRRLDYHRERCQKTDLIRKSLVKSVCSFLSKEITSFSLTIHVSFEQREVGIKLPFDTHLPTEVWPALCSTTMPSRSVKTARVRQAFGQDIFSGGPKGGGEIRSKFRKIFRRWFSFIVKNYEYTKRDLHEMALCVLNEDEWIIYYIYYTYIFIQRYSDFTFVLSLSLSLLLALLKPMNPCHRRVRSTGTPTSANCLCCWPFGVSVKFYEESSEKLERCKHIQCMNIWFCYILLRCLQMCLVYMVTWNISSWTGFWVALKKGVLSRRISRVVSLKYSPEQIHILNLPKNWWNWVCVDVFPFPKRKHWFRSQPLLFREGDGSELNSPTSMANDPKSGTVKCGTLRCEMGECKHVCFSFFFRGVKSQAFADMQLHSTRVGEKIGVLSLEVCFFPYKFTNDDTFRLRLRLTCCHIMIPDADLLML